MRVRKTPGSFFVLTVAVALLAGCTIQIVGPDNGTPPPTPTTIVIQMVNQTGKPLDPQLFVGPVSAGSAALFVPANKRTDFGFGGLGLLEANGMAQVTIGCDQVVFIGTQGGIFGDDLTNPVAQGQALVLQAGLSVPCGDVLTFTYTAAGSTLSTSYAVAPQ